MDSGLVDWKAIISKHQSKNHFTGQDFWEYIGEIKWQYKHLECSINYNLIDSYDEINLKFGYIFNY